MFESFPPWFYFRLRTDIHPSIFPPAATGWALRRRRDTFFRFWMLHGLSKRRKAAALSSAWRWSHSGGVCSCSGLLWGHDPCLMSRRYLRWQEGWRVFSCRHLRSGTFLWAEVENNAWEERHADSAGYNTGSPSEWHVFTSLICCVAPALCSLSARGTILKLMHTFA